MSNSSSLWCADRFIPFTAARPATGVLYADAFFLEGEKLHNTGWVPNAQMTRSQRAANGWGLATSPVRFACKFDTARAYIYMLEVLAQILAVVTLADYLGKDWVAFINKGYGRDAAVNGLLFAFWSLAATRSWRPTFCRVTSEANIADPISQADCALAVRHGWSQADTNLTGILEILAWAADEIEYAVHRAASDLQAL